MRYCKIAGCETTGRNKERSLFQIIGDKKKWIPLILAHQELNIEQHIYICDLHFDQNDLIIKAGLSTRLKAGAIPQLSLPVCTNLSTNASYMDSHPCSSLSSPSEQNARDSTDTSSNRTNGNFDSHDQLISKEVYKKLLNSSVELISANEKIKKLTVVIQKQNDLIKQLKSKMTKQAELDHLTPNQKEVIQILINGLHGRYNKYPEAVRKFCLRMQFHSSSAYREMRAFFNNKLPTIRSLQGWLTCIDASPGITQVALDVITDKAAAYKSQGEQLLLCLSYDEMSLRQQVQFNKSKMSFSGLSEDTNSTNNMSKVPIVKDALVFMAVGTDFRITVAYQLLRGMTAIDRAVFAREVIRRVDLTGAKVISFTGDGLHANLAVAKLLGANFDDNKPYFQRPCNPKENIYIIFDPPHMIKLLRKYLSEQNLQHGENKMEWELLKKLAAKQGSENFSLTNKLSQNHILWMDHKMNVKKAVQIFSNENADALEQLCEDLYGDFIGCEKFTEFLRLTNNIFDIMNFGEGKKTDHHFKQPLCPSTIGKFRELFDSFKRFVFGMTIEIKQKKNVKRVPVVTQMGFVGLLINIESTIGIYEDYVKQTKSCVFYTFQYGQDNLETYFSLIRASLGCNNNPNSEQFQCAYRKLLFCAPHISGSVKTNCNVEFPKQLLNVSSSSSNIMAVPQCSMQISKILLARSIEIEIDYSTLINIELEPYEQHVYALMASAVETEIIARYQRQTTASCQDCLSVFSQNSRIFDDLVRKKIGRGALHAQPCFSTLNIILATEEINKKLQSIENINYVCAAKTIFNIIGVVFENDLSLYESSDFDLHQQNEVHNIPITHKEEFILQVIHTFLTMKSKLICHRISLEEQAEDRNKRLNKRIRILTGK